MGCMVLVLDLVLCVMAQGSLRSLGPTHIFTTGPSTSTMLSDWKTRQAVE